MIDGTALIDTFKVCRRPLLKKVLEKLVFVSADENHIVHAVHVHAQLMSLK